MPGTAGWELRLGAFAHDPASPERGSADLNAEFLTPKLFRLENSFANIFVPRAHVGTTLNFGGRTSHAFAGLSWTVDLTDAVFVEVSMGGAVHNGKTGATLSPKYNPLGCNPLFRESGSVGYRLSQNWSIMGTVEHLSNAGLCARNRGLTNFGARMGYSF